ncbi:hypothetical protein AMELA_G00201860 [Ameiurus melas]|uniref:Uncharacterized protein n=1 Tax=Ameiurus melas TaxID=219545 RepID=A0A7J6AB11_AMEME|nr:hypothetical protein AMELA_G00201860 [Ameiurus melas]
MAPRHVIQSSVCKHASAACDCDDVEKAATNRNPGVCESGAGFQCGAVEILMRRTRCFGHFRNAERTTGSRSSDAAAGRPGDQPRASSGEWKVLHLSLLLPGLSIFSFCAAVDKQLIRNGEHFQAHRALRLFYC